MSYSSVDTSVYGGKVVRLFHFRRGVNLFRYTSSDAAIVYFGSTFEPAAIDCGEIDDGDDTENTLEIYIDRNSPIASRYMTFVPTGKTTIEVFENHRGDSEFLPVFEGTIVAPNFAGNMLTLYAKSIDSVMERMICTEKLSPLCTRRLYRPPCGVDINAYLESGTIASVSGYTVTSSLFSSHPSGYYKAGLAIRNGEDYRMIIAHTGSTITLQVPFDNLVIGEILQFAPGCDLTKETCDAKFHNLDRHLSFPFVTLKNPVSKGVK